MLDFNNTKCYKKILVVHKQYATIFISTNIKVRGGVSSYKYSKRIQLKFI